MSYDVSLEIETGAGNWAEVAEVGNITYNVSPMFRKALAPDGLRGLDGHRAGECLRDLDAGVIHMTTYPAEYRELNPPNGWGNYEDTLRFLRRLRDLVKAHPATTIRIN